MVRPDGWTMKRPLYLTVNLGLPALRASVTLTLGALELPECFAEATRSAALLMSSRRTQYAEQSHARLKRKARKLGKRNP